MRVDLIAMKMPILSVSPDGRKVVEEPGEFVIHLDQVENEIFDAAALNPKEMRELGIEVRGYLDESGDAIFYFHQATPENRVDDEEGHG